MAHSSEKTAQSDVMDCLVQIFQSEVSGIIRYLHYSFMIMGHNRIPIQNWLRQQAQESMAHATAIGEKITSLGGHPPVVSGGVEESNIHSVDQILTESLRFEEASLNLYKKLVHISGDDIALEEMAREFVRIETEHLDEVRKMLRSK
jgi:bacterioferritin